MILAILQARMSSTRLPGKVLAPLLGRPMLVRQIERIRQANTLDKLVVATSEDPSDDAIARLCDDVGTDCFRGNLNDVLDRFYRAASHYTPEHIVRLTGDCPLTDPRVIDAVVHLHVAGRFDYSSNSLDPTFPDGICVEVIRADCLNQAWAEARLPSEREHVTPFLYKRPGRFRLGSLKGQHDHSQIRLTVDESVDLEVVRPIFEALYPRNPNFGLDEILQWLDEHPELKALNAALNRGEGYRRSIARDGAA